jgi:hypothetical protein
MKQAFGCLLLALVSVSFVKGGLMVVSDSQVLSAQTSSLTLEERVSRLESRVAVLEGSKNNVSQKKQEFLKNIDGGGSASLGWSKVFGSDFVLDPSLYGNITQVTWQGWLEVKDGNGIGYARIYDVTNKRGVDGSEVRILSGVKSSFYSLPLSIWRGSNDYYIEVKSNTGYEVVITEPKIKIVIN